MKEIICLHVGQAGVQMGNAIWELFCAEHGINESGILKEPSLNIECLDTFFSISHSEKYVPRCIFVDLEPTVIDEVRTGSYKNLFHPDRLVAGPEDAASNFARGFFTVGKLLLGVISHEIRRLLENGANTQAFFIFRSLGGGTGSGLTSAIFDSLIEYPKLVKIEMPIYPSPTLSTAMVEPYNCLLGEHFCMEDIDVGLLIDNEALYDVCSKYLNVANSSYNTINRLIGQLTSSITASVRFESVMNCDISVLQTNLVPYPRIHFPLANFAPVLSASKACHEELSVSDLTRAVFEKENQMMKIDHSFGRFMSCSLFYRGAISPYHVYIALNEIKRDKNIEFVDWCPTGFKVGINTCPPTTIPASFICQTSKNVAMLANTSAIGQAWQRLTHKFYLLYSKRSFVHWFIGEGMEECEFTESLYNISALVKDYEEVVADRDSKQESTLQNPGFTDKVNSQEVVNQLNAAYAEDIQDRATDNDESCIKYQVSMSEPETGGVDDETNEESNQDIRRSQEDKEADAEEENLEVEEEAGDEAGEEAEEEAVEEVEETAETGEEESEEVEQEEEENLEELLGKDGSQESEEVETTEEENDNANENQSFNVSNQSHLEDIGNCTAIIENLMKCKERSIKIHKTKSEKSKVIKKLKRKSSKTLSKKKIGNSRFHY